MSSNDYDFDDDYDLTSSKAQMPIIFFYFVPWIGLAICAFATIILIIRKSKSQMTAKLDNAEKVVKEKSYHIDSLQDELAIVGREVVKSKIENNTLNMKLHLREKYISILDLQIKKLQCDLKDKNDLIARLHENLSSEQTKRRLLEEICKEKHIKRTTLEEALKKKQD